MSVSLSAERDRIQRQVEELEQSLSATNADLQLMSNESDAEDSEEEGRQRERIQQEIQNLENVLGEQRGLQSGGRFTEDRRPAVRRTVHRGQEACSQEDGSPRTGGLQSGGRFTEDRRPAVRRRFTRTGGLQSGGRLFSSLAASETPSFRLVSSLAASETPSFRLVSSLAASETPSFRLVSSLAASETPSFRLVSSLAASETPLFRLVSSLAASETPSFRLVSSLAASETPSFRLVGQFTSSVETPSFRLFSSLAASETPLFQVGQFTSKSETPSFRLFSSLAASETPLFQVVQFTSSVETPLSDDSSSEESDLSVPSEVSCLSPQSELSVPSHELGVPPSPEGCLQMNLVYQQVLQETLQQLEDLLTNNNRQQKELVSQLSGPIRERPQEQPASSSCQPSIGMYLGRFLKPTQGQAASLGPPANQEAREKASRMSGCLDEKQLKIKRLSRDSLRKLIQPKLSKVDYLSQKLGKKEEELIGDRYDEHDWQKISNIDFEGTRDSEDIRLFWRNFLHPAVSKAAWSKEEVEELREASSRHEERHWESIAEERGGQPSCVFRPISGSSRSR
ncbi:snRNA-activating protein complex subunit 4 [Dissostichus eleginoides]|uniref:snRNA-activating protein complex subunit 4 n=1 Tax=Dissostichus eleginoides TaxID=100907 RepID=A0AAD9ESM3_DISEL|nr:snRNA-activating protein complex subunit 4 [Dissostichus eleginoides]